MGSTTKIVIDQRGGGNLLYLPLDKIMQMSGATRTEPQSKSEPAAATEQSTARSRDAFRSREREAR